MDTRLPPKVEICVPPALREEAIQKANDNLHPAWSKGMQRGKHFVIATDSLEDLSELADFARVELEEPDEPLSKVRRAACQALLNRTHRFAVLEPLGDCHCIAVEWREQPLRGCKSSSKVLKELNQASRSGPSRFFS